MLIKIDNLTKIFGTRVALSGITAELPKGKIIGLAGPDGSGKTTLIRLLAGLLLPTSGTISIEGITSIEQLHESIGYMPQRFGLYEDLTAMENLILYADLNNVTGEERKKAFEKLLAFTNLSKFTNVLARKLSGGMKQKLGLACTLIRKPMLLLLDEPTVGVDPISRRELWKMVQNLLAEGISIVWSTSYLEEAESCHSVLLLSDGKLLYHGPPHELTAKMEGRTFKLRSPDRRKTLTALLNRPDIVDGVIQGSDVRVVMKNTTPPSPEWTPCPPRFEDAFVDLLGGAPKGTSKLAENYPSLEKNKTTVEAEHLTKKFGAFTAVDNISFAVKSGEVFGLLGPNGAGKSTTFKMLCGLWKPTEGKSLVPEKEHMGYMAQKFSLYSGLSVLQNLQFFSGAYGSKNSVDKMIKIFNLEPYLDTSAGDLPLGYKQRLALACSAMHHPEVLFLDEPTSGVDPITRREFWNHINGLVEKGTTVVVTTHFMEEAEYCDRIGLIFNGKVITIGTPDALKEKAHTEENPTPTLEDAFIHLVEAAHEG